MSLVITRKKPAIWKIEHDNYWKGQMKHEVWMLTHNEEVDYKYCNWDVDWDRNES